MKELPATARIIDLDSLPHSPTAWQFEGAVFGAEVSFFIVTTPPGGGPGLHRHPYPELFVVQQGEATFTVGDETLAVRGGQLVLAPAGVPHAFRNTGSEPLRQIDIHPVGRMVTEWLDGGE